MADVHPAPRVRRDYSTLGIMAATLVAIVASIASWSTVGRLTVAIMFAIAVVVLVHQHGEQDRRGWTVGAAIVFVVLAWLHVVLTSPSVAWAVDSHMVPWLPLPSGTSRVTVAWSCSLAWTALVAIAMLQIRGFRARPAAIMLLGLTGVLPLFNPDGFAVDGYELLWNRSTFTHPTYTIALLSFLATTAVLHQRTSTPDD